MRSDDPVRRSGTIGRMTPRVLAVPLAVAVAAFGACGAGSSTSSPEGPATAAPARAPQVITAAQHGRTFRLARGRDVELRLASGTRLRSTGRAARSTPIDFVVDPGYAAWQLSGVAPGRTVLTGHAGGERFRLTLVVPG
jgi:hypothetical protein